MNGKRSPSRDKKIYQRHKEDPVKWSSRKLGRLHNLSHTRILQICKEQKEIEKENPEEEARRANPDNW